MNFSHNDQAVPKNITGIAVVVVLHIVIVYALASGLAREVVEVIRKPVEATIIQEIKPPAPDVPPPRQPKPVTPPPKTKLPPAVFAPRPEVAVEATPPPNAIAAVPDAIPPAPPVPSAVASESKSPVHTMAVVDSSKCGKPPYPGAALRNEEEGTVTLEFLIGVDGTVLDSKVGKSSGYQDLDRAARVGLSLCKFRPAFTDGKPEQSWTRMQYVWKLE
ncbi:MAG TPA: energy transducer TonB [Herbaspirillum sp.]|jgi:protein TonB